jgi:hypothetical protein
MALRAVLNDLVEVPGDLRELYKPTADGRFALDVDGELAGYVKADKLNEFRTNNRTLHGRVKEFETENAALVEKLKAFEGTDPKKSETDVAAAVEAAKAELAAELAAERTAHAATLLRNAVSVEFLKAAGRESAVDFIVARATEAFAFKDGKPTTNEFSAENPGEALSIAEWVGQQTHNLDFAFRPSRGGGAGGNSTGASARRTVSRDPMDFGKNLAAIAAGDVDVL